MRWHRVADIARLVFRGMTSQTKDPYGAESLYYYFDDDNTIRICADKIVIRISNHGTTIKNHAAEMHKIFDKNRHRKDAADYQNYSFVFPKQGNPLNHRNVNPSILPNPNQRPFNIYQYVYPINRLSYTDVINIFDSVKQVIIGNKSCFIDPLQGTSKQCFSQVLTPNQEVVNWNNYDQAQNEFTDESLKRRTRNLNNKHTSRKALIAESMWRNSFSFEEPKQKETQGLREAVAKALMDEYRAIRQIPLREDANGSRSYTMSMREMQEMMLYINKRLDEGLLAARYKVVDSPKSFQTTRGHKAHPMLTLSNGTDTIHIVRDDSHYIVYTETEDGKFDVAKWIHPDVIKAIHKVIVSSQL